MSSLQELLDAIDRLAPDELEIVRRHVEQHHLEPRWVVMRGSIDRSETAESTPEDEINAVLEEVLVAVDHEQTAASHIIPFRKCGGD